MENSENRERSRQSRTTRRSPLLAPRFLPAEANTERVAVPRQPIGKRLVHEDRVRRTNVAGNETTPSRELGAVNIEHVE